MSVRAELVRLGLRWFLKPTNRPGVTIARRREQTGRFVRWVPRPPADAESVCGELGGVAVLRVATPLSDPFRHILFLHGGGYVTGAPELYRHMLWRVAAAAAARVTAVRYRLAPEHPFPAALDDALAAWRGLLAEGMDPRHAAVMGDAAGWRCAWACGCAMRGSRCRPRSSPCRRGPTSP